MNVFQRILKILLLICIFFILYTLLSTLNFYSYTKKQNINKENIEYTKITFDVIKTFGFVYRIKYIDDINGYYYSFSYMNNKLKYFIYYSESSNGYHLKEVDMKYPVLEK